MLFSHWYHQRLPDDIHWLAGPVTNDVPQAWYGTARGKATYFQAAGSTLCDVTRHAACWSSLLQAHLVKMECCPKAQVGLLYVLDKKHRSHQCKHTELGVVLRLGGAQQVNQQAPLWL